MDALDTGRSITSTKISTNKPSWVKQALISFKENLNENQMSKTPWDKNFFDRLHSRNEKTAQWIIDLWKEKSEAEMKECTFTPEIKQPAGPGKDLEISFGNGELPSFRCHTSWSISEFLRDQDHFVKKWDIKVKTLQRQKIQAVEAELKTFKKKKSTDLMSQSAIMDLYEKGKLK